MRKKYYIVRSPAKWDLPGNGEVFFVLRKRLFLVDQIVYSCASKQEAARWIHRELTEPRVYPVANHISASNMMRAGNKDSFHG